jgi:hemerythrin-like metal-binding protein
MKEGKAKNILEFILDDLISYTKEHFRTEERMMLNANFPGLKEHCKEHEKLTEKVIDFQKSFIEGKALITMDLMNFLKNWLINHIEGTDKKYKDKLS